MYDVLPAVLTKTPLSTHVIQPYQDEFPQRSQGPYCPPLNAACGHERSQPPPACPCSTLLLTLHCLRGRPSSRSWTQVICGFAIKNLLYICQKLYCRRPPPPNLVLKAGTRLGLPNAEVPMQTSLRRRFRAFPTLRQRWGPRRASSTRPLVSASLHKGAVERCSHSHLRVVPQYS